MKWLIGLMGREMAAMEAWAADSMVVYNLWENGRVGNEVLGLHTRGGTVFTCGSTDWSHGLAGGDPVVDRVTRTIIERLSQ